MTTGNLVVSPSNSISLYQSGQLPNTVVQVSNTNPTTALINQNNSSGLYNASGIIFPPSGDVIGNNFAAQGNITALGYISAVGNVYGSYMFGNGFFLTDINGGNIVGGYGNAQVAAFLQVYNGNITAWNISTFGNITTSANVFANTLNGNTANIATLIFPNGARADQISNGLQISASSPAGQSCSGLQVVQTGNSTLWANANVVIQSNYCGTVNSLVFDNKGNLSGLNNLSVTGNITANNIRAITSITIGNSSISNGNLSVGNIFVSGVVSAVGAVTGSILLNTGNVVRLGLGITNDANANANTVSIGSFAGDIGQSQDAVAIGRAAGQTNQGDGAIAIGRIAGNTNQGANSIAIGFSAGEDAQGAQSIAIGFVAGNTNQGANAIAIGRGAGNSSQGNGGVAFGQGAGAVNQGANSISIGRSAGNSDQDAQSVAIGFFAGNTSQGANAVALGRAAGQQFQGNSAIAIGQQAGNTNQSDGGIAIGTQAGRDNQGGNAIAIGRFAAATGAQGANAIAIGRSAGNIDQGNTSIAIGHLAGNNLQGSGAIAIGYGAGNTNQAANSIVITAGGNLTSTNQGFYVNPVRQDDANVANAVYFNQTTKEITFGPTTGYSNANVANYLPIYSGVMTAVGNITSSGRISANSFGNILSSGVISTAGNVIGNNLIGNIIGNIISVTGNINAGNISLSGNIVANTVSATGSLLAGQGIYFNNANGLGVLSGAGIFATAGVLSVGVGGYGGGGYIRAFGQISATGDVKSQNSMYAEYFIANTGFIGNGFLLNNINGANIVGPVANANTAGTVTNNAQPNITSVGTLTLLNVNGNVQAGNLRTTGMLSATGNGVIGNLYVGDPAIGDPGELVSGNLVNQFNIATSTISIVSNAGGPPAISATGNVFISPGATGANLFVTGGFVSVNGNVIAKEFFGNISGNINSGNIITLGYNLSNPAPAGLVVGNANIASILWDGTASWRVSQDWTSSGDATSNLGSPGNRWNNLYSANVIGTAATFSDSVSAAGNITGGNLRSSTVQAVSSAGLSLKNSGGTTQASLGAGGGDNFTISVSTNINGANAQVDISPTGTGHVHIKPTGNGAVEIAPTNLGSMNNMIIGNVTPQAIIATTISATGALTANNITTLGNVSGNYILGNGSLLTGIVASSVSANALTGNTLSSNVLFSSLTSLGTLGNLSVTGNTTSGNLLTSGIISSTGNAIAGNILTTGLISSTGNVIGNFFIGNGSQLTGIISNYGNSNVANYLPIYSGVMTAVGNIISSGLISATGQIYGNNLLSVQNDISTTFGNIVASQGNIQGNNVRVSNQLSVQGNIIGLGNANLTGNISAFSGNIANNFNITNSLDVLGDTRLGDVGNILATTQTTVYGFLDVSRGIEASGTQARISATGNISTNSFFIGNGAFLSGITTNYGNANVANYLPTYSGVMTAVGNIASTGFISATGNILTISNVSATGNVTGNFFIGNGAFLTGISGGNSTYGDANVAAFLPTYTGNLGNTGNSVSVQLVNYKDVVYAGGNGTGTITPDAGNGSIYKYTLTGNITLNAMGGTPQAGQHIIIVLTQDATGNRLLTSTMKWAGGFKTLSTAANSIDIATIWYDGSTYYGALTRGYA